MKQLRYLFTGNTPTYFGPKAIYFGVPDKELDICEEHLSDPSMEATLLDLTRVLSEDEKLAKIANENKVAREEIKDTKEEAEKAKAAELKAKEEAEKAKAAELKAKEEADQKMAAEFKMEADKKKAEAKSSKSFATRVRPPKIKET